MKQGATTWAVVRGFQVGLLMGLVSIHGSASEPKVKAEVSEFIFEEAPFRECHASTILELPGGELLAAWFGGEREGDNSVRIWLSRKPVGGAWSPPEAMTSFTGAPCWNPVLFRDTANRVWLFFKVGPDEESWVGAYRTSDDGGKNWSVPQYLPAGLLGPIRNKPLLLSNGTILCGTSREAGMRQHDTREQPYWTWTAWVERSEDSGKNWTIHGPIVFPGVNYGVIQPTLWETHSGQIRMLLRSTEKIGYICESVSSDGGLTWSPARATTLPNPNSAIDAVKMGDGTVALVYNHSRTARSPLNIAFSHDDGITWGAPNVLEDAPGEYSYPAIIQSAGGKLHITYTWKRRRIKHVVLDPEDFRM